jgi:CBS domain-containing protein
MRLRDIMTRNVEDIAPQTTLKEAAQKMKSLDVGALPVCQNDQIIGMLTDRDITVRAVADGRDPKTTRASDAMTAQIIWCYEDDDVGEAARLMEEKRIRRLVVCDRNKRPVGIVSLGDLAIRMPGDHLSSEVLEQVSEPAQPHA